MALKSPMLRAALLAAISLAAVSAQAATTCESLPNPIYVAGSSASQSIWTQIGPSLFDAGATVVYQSQGSCTGVTYIENLANDPTSDTGLASGSTALYFPPGADGGSASCTVTPTGTTTEKVNVGVSDVFQATCDAVNSVSTPPALGNFNGPTQAMLFLQPRDPGVSVHAISAEEAFYVLGFASGGDVSPWNQPNESQADGGFLYIRNSQSGTQSMVAGAIALPPALFLGFNTGGTGAVISGVSGKVGTTNESAALGIAVAGSYDKDRSKTQALAFREYGQNNSWLPDSSDTTYDKRNVRAGRYAISGPLQFVYTGTSSTPSDTQAATLINYLSGTTPLPGSVTLIDAEIAASTIPSCAMAVTHSGANGNSYQDLMPNTRTHSCDCYFESKAKAAAAPLAICAGLCTSASQCPGGVCGPLGVCEAF